MSNITERREVVRGGSAVPAFWASPFNLMRRFTDEMDRLFEDIGNRREWLTWPFESGEDHWRPDVEMFEKDGQLVVRVDLPGLTKNDVKVDVTEEALTIRGERRSTCEETGGFYRSERSYGSFYRLIPLPEGVTLETVNATFHEGVLEVTMKAPARPKIEPRHVEVKDTGVAKARAKTAA